MREKISVALYETHGNPPDVLRVVSQDRPRAAADEAIVEIRFTPVNPADLNAIEGKYPVKPQLPATPGMEGAGVVVEVGSDVTDLAVGTPVILPHNFGTWREIAAVKAEKLVAAPDEIDAMQLAMLKINPLTAWRMLHDFVTLRPNEWVIQNAANSGAGRAVIQIAKERGWRTVNVVRRAELIDELRAEGGDVVVVASGNLRDEVREQTGKADMRLALNAVGGENALHVAKCLASDGVMVTYGAMSLEPLTVPNGMLIFKNLNFTGFWVNKWYDTATAQQRAETFEQLFAMAGRGKLRTKVERVYPLADVRAAVADAARGRREGKIVLDLQPH